MRFDATATAKERPILFSGEMVRAILDGKKTQTRRVMKPQPLTDDFAHFKTTLGYPASEGKLWAGFWLSLETKKASEDSNGEIGSPGYFQSPYGMEGERLWVREAWRCHGGPEYEYQHEQRSIIYRATAELIDSGPWKPSIFMPRWASRLILEVTEIGVQRVHEISHDDAVAEGCYRIEPCETYPHGNTWGRAGYAILWDKINKARGYSWASKPWVWVVKFKRILES